ncbi:MAG: porin [Candidatus Halichondribacter symbioticus]
MKKLLISTTALVAVTGIAHAEVTLTGTAEAGITQGTNADDALGYHTDMDINFRGVGTTDSGFQFGATIDLDEAVNISQSNGNVTSASQIPSKNSPASVFISSSGFGTLTMGDTDGAFDRVLDEVGMLTLIADDHTTHAGYNGNSGTDGSGKSSGADQILRYDRQFGIFEIAVSWEFANGSDQNAGWGIGGALDFGGGERSSFGVGLGLQSAGDDFLYGLSATAKFSGVDLVFNYSTTPQGDAAAGGTHIGLGVGYTINDFAVSFNYGTYSGGDSKKDGKSGWGLAVNYALSGGAVIQGGLGSGGSSNGAGGEGALQYSVGLSLNF